MRLRCGRGSVEENAVSLTLAENPTLREVRGINTLGKPDLERSDPSCH